MNAGRLGTIVLRKLRKATVRSAGGSSSGGARRRTSRIRSARTCSEARGWAGFCRWAWPFLLRHYFEGPPLIAAPFAFVRRAFALALCRLSRDRRDPGARAGAAPFPQLDECRLGRPSAKPGWTLRVSGRRMTSHRFMLCPPGDRRPDTHGSGRYPLQPNDPCRACPLLDERFFAIFRLFSSKTSGS